LFFRTSSSVGQRAKATGCPTALIIFFEHARAHRWLLRIRDHAYREIFSRVLLSQKKFFLRHRWLSETCDQMSRGPTDVARSPIAMRLCAFFPCASQHVFPLLTTASLALIKKVIPVGILSSRNFFNYGNVCVMAFTSAVRAVAKEMVFEDEQLIFYFRLRRVLLLCFSFLLSKHSRPG
jgi:hypothetical protein